MSVTNTKVISCIIYIERESQKGILIGKNGKALKSLGISSRKSIQNFIKKKVFLTFNVKVLFIIFTHL